MEIVKVPKLRFSSYYGANKKTVFSYLEEARLIYQLDALN